jgi:hypothetical protein
VYSLFLHIQCPDHRVSSSFEDGLTIYFPDFYTQAFVGQNDIYLDAVPCDEVVSDTSDTQELSVTPTDSVCNHITQFQTDVDVESTKVDNLLLSLQCYYNEVKTKRQLNMEVPAGFRCQNQWQLDTAYHDTLKHSTILQSSDDVLDGSSLSTLSSNIQESSLIDSCHIHQHQVSVPDPIPIVRSVGKPSTSLLISRSKSFISLM